MAEAAAQAQQVDPCLVRAIIDTESSWNPKAIRFEPNWKYLWFAREFSEKLQVPYDEEVRLQSSSLGLMQIMGGVARELGFTGNLNDLFDPAVNLQYGIKKLQKLLKKYPDEMDAISSYNQGHPAKSAGGMYLNQRYVDKVSACLRGYRALAQTTD